MQRPINSFFQRKRKVVAFITYFQFFSVIEPKFNFVLGLLVFSEATLSFIPSSRDGGVSEEATGDGRKPDRRQRHKYRKLFVRAQLKHSPQVEDQVPFIDGL